MLTADQCKARALLMQEVRSYFHNQGFLETDTPSLVFSPGMEPHIRPIAVENRRAFLPTSPEFAMKRLLARGYEKIFQICKAYRLEPKSSTHNPEFTILEWYRGHSDYEQIMDDVEGLFVAIAERLHGSTKFNAGPYGIQDVSRPWLRLTMEECFKRYADLNLAALLEVRPMADACIAKKLCGKEVLSELEKPGLWDDLFFLVVMNFIEPALAKLQKPVIVYHYPESQAALSNLHTDSLGHKWAKRFEVYAGGLELGNAFDELTDPVAQRMRFEKDMLLRERLYGKEFPANPIDEDFLKALEKMPPSGGIAMGVDRICMYFMGASSIDEVLWLPSYFSS